MRRYLLRAIALIVLGCPLFPASAITRTWVGAVSNNFSEPNNWAPAGTPAPSDTLLFPYDSNSTMTNDLPVGTSFGPMTFSNHLNVVLSGNPLILTGDVTINTNFTCNADLKAGASLTLGGNGGPSTFNGAIDVNGQTLKISGYSTNVKALNGTGVVTVDGTLFITGDGTFSGPITGALDVEASIPNANLLHSGAVWPSLTGTGTLGSVEAQAIAPGTSVCCGGNPYGTLTTKSLYIGGPTPNVGATANFDLNWVNPTGQSDSIHVIGTVTLNNPTLSVALPAGLPTTGEQFTIIDNDGSDAVSGTFNGLPEGAVFDVGGADFSISYHGGDGNDVVLTVVSVQKTWVGAVNSLWSTPSNWKPGAAPVAGEPLLFPASSNGTMTNDLPAGMSFGPMTFNNYVTLGGNLLTLGGDVTLGNGGSFTCNADLKIGTSLTLNAGNPPTFNGAIDVNGQTLKTEGYGPKIKALNGTGVVILDVGMMTITGDGTFSGSITGGGGLDVEGSIPNANLMHQGSSYPSLVGTGTLGNAEAVSLIPGTWLGGNPFGTLTTKSLFIGGSNANAGATAYFDLNPANPSGESDSIHVIGTVTLFNPTLTISFPAGLPTPGQQFRIIDNDGSDAVSGTFAGLPEGAVFDVNGVDLGISYRGGDGNDVVLTVMAVEKTWVGAVNSLWSNPQNWKPGAAPAPGEPLMFPKYSNGTMTNDLPAGTSFGPLTVNNDGIVNGNLLTLMGDVISGANFTCNADVKLGAPVTVGLGRATFNGAVDVNGQTLRITAYDARVKALNGSGTVVVDTTQLTITGDGTFDGPVAGAIILDGSIPNANLVNHGSLSGNGTIGTVDAVNVSPSKPGQNPFGILSTKSLNIGGSYPSASFDLNPANPTGESDSIHVTGTVTLNSPALSVGVIGVPSLGQTFVIIDNDGTDPVAGTFAGLPEGSTVPANGYLFRLTYVGGDGNDVALIAASQPDAVVSQNVPSSVVGETITLNATVSSQFGTPQGSITFVDNGVPLGVAPLVNGGASLNVPFATAGSHSISAVYSGGGVFVSATSSPMTHFVARGETATSFGGTVTAVYGQTQIRTTTLPKAPAAGTVTGSVTLAEGAASVATATLAGGNSVFDASSLKPGTHTLTATYAGSTSFDGSSSDAFQVTVDRAATHVDLSVDGPVLKVFILPIGSVPEIPTGTLTVSDNGTIVQQQPIAGNASLTLTLGAGHHTLHVGYSGDALFQQSSNDVDVDGGAASRHRAVHH